MIIYYKYLVSRSCGNQLKENEISRNRAEHPVSERERERERESEVGGGIREEDGD